MRNLSLGKQTYRKLVEQDLIYVDKTEIIYKMISEGGEYFLSRPRRFGKSLTLSTLKEIFKGSKELFKNTYIYDTNYDWQEYPVIHIDFSEFDSSRTVEELDIFIREIIDKYAKSFNIFLDAKLTTSRFAELIEKLSKKNRVVLLIDEYDNPIISNILNLKKAKEIQEILRGFYKIIKSQDENIHFVFLTGVTKFSQVSVFSALNNLTDLTMNEHYAALCGYTEKEIKENFKEYINRCADNLNLSEEELFSEIKQWYNGFRFSKTSETVYNPWSTLSFFNTGEFENYWFQTGSPTFLINLIKTGDNFMLPDLSNKSVAVKGFSTFDIEKLQIIPLLVQTGYLTISKYDRQYKEYYLDFPNQEVKDSFIQNLLTSELQNDDSDSILSELRKSLQKNDLELFFESMDILMSKVDYDLHLKDEKYWQSLFYMILTLLGYKIFAEFKTVKGRIDAVIETDSHIYIFEFKTTSSEEVALNQIKEREYYKRFMDSPKEIVLIGSRFVVEDKKIINKYIISANS